VSSAERDARMIQLGRLIGQRRALAGLSVRQLAARLREQGRSWCGMERDLEDVEAGRHATTRVPLAHLATALGVDQIELDTWYALASTTPPDIASWLEQHPEWWDHVRSIFTRSEA